MICQLSVFLFLSALVFWVFCKLENSHLISATLFSNQRIIFYSSQLLSSQLEISLMKKTNGKRSYHFKKLQNATKINVYCTTKYCMPDIFKTKSQNHSNSNFFIFNSLMDQFKPNKAEIMVRLLIWCECEQCLSLLTLDRLLSLLGWCDDQTFLQSRDWRWW